MATEVKAARNEQPREQAVDRLPPHLWVPLEDAGASSTWKVFRLEAVPIRLRMADAREWLAVPRVRPDPDPPFLELAILARGIREQEGVVRARPRDRKTPVPKSLSRYFQLKCRLE